MKQGIQPKSDFIRKLRRARRMTQLELALVAGVSERTVRNAETGVAVRPNFLSYIAGALGTELADVIEVPAELYMAERGAHRIQRLMEGMSRFFGDMDETDGLNQISRNVLWRSLGPDSIPFNGEHRGRDGVRRFFDQSKSFIESNEAPKLIDARTDGELVIIDMTAVHYFSNRPDDKQTSCGRSVFEYEGDRIVRADLISNQKFVDWCVRSTH